jgi:hypothetical protein
MRRVVCAQGGRAKGGRWACEGWQVEVRTRHASGAASSARGKFDGQRCARAAAVVPPGEVMSFRKAATCCPDAFRYAVDPSTVLMTSFSETSRGKPMCTPVSIIASMNMKVYAGPDPTIAVATATS